MKDDKYIKKEWESIFKIFEKEWEEFEVDYDTFKNWLENTYFIPINKETKENKLPPNHPDTFDETGYVKDEYNQFKNPKVLPKTYIEKIAETLWEKWALNLEDHIFLTKDLFLLALQDEILLRFFRDKITTIEIDKLIFDRDKEIEELIDEKIALKIKLSNLWKTTI